MRSTLVMLLAGGVGSRLNILGAARAKPAVPFGGSFRIIDFTLSNAMNSGLHTVGVLTQYKPLSLMKHIGSGEAWDFIGRTRGAKILPPRTGQKDSDWYKGTADAVRQNIDFIESHNPARVLVLSGDHIYKMDYRSLIEFHKNREADITIGMMPVPWEETHHFGIGITDSEQRIIEWEEKPEKARNNLASMGIYVFEADYLLRALRKQPGNDFGKNIIPDALGRDRVYAYPFKDYWRDVGTLKAYWDANMDLLNPESGLDIDNWKIRTNIEEEGRLGDRPPVHVAPSGSIKNSVISAGCVIKGTVENSILSPGVLVSEDTVVRDSVLMHDCILDPGAEVDACIMDKDVQVGAKAKIGTGSADKPNKETPGHLWHGLVVIGKNARIPAQCQVGKNSIIYPDITDRDFDVLNIAAGGTIKPKH